LFPLEFGNQFVFARQLKAVRGGEDLLLAFGQGVFDDRVVLVGAQKDADRRIFPLLQVFKQKPYKQRLDAQNGGNHPLVV